MGRWQDYTYYWTISILFGFAIPARSQDTIQIAKIESHRSSQSGYDTEVAGAQSRINQNSRLAGTADQMLQGTAAGVYSVQNSGQPGGEVGVHIRGFRTLYTSNQPLYIIDGIPYYNETDWSSAGTVFGPAISPLTFLNPQDIEEISVLKDAGAAALYGSRSANGVILIQTKRSLPDSLRVSLNINFGTQDPIDRYDLATAADYAGFLNQAYSNAGFPVPYNNPASLGTGTDWQNAIYRDQAWRQNYHLGISGGSDEVKYYLSGEYLEQQGLVIGSGLQRYSFRANVHARLNDKAILQNSLAFNRIDYRSIPSDANYDGSGVDVISGSRIFNPILPHQNNDGSINAFHFFADDAGNATGKLQSILAQPNPLLLAGSTDSKSSTSRVQNHLQLSYHLMDDLSVTGTIGVDALFNEEYTFIPGALFFNDARGTGSGAKVDALKFINQYYLKYHREYGDKQDLQLMAGYSFEGWRRELLAGRAIGFDNETLRYYSLTVGQQKVLNSDISEWGMQSFFGRGSYSLRETYSLTLVARADAPSQFGNEWTFFPALTFSWNLGQSGLIKNSKNLSSLTLRSSIGTSGNQSMAPYGRFSLLNEYNAALNGATINGISIFRLGNRDLEVEKTQKFNFGFELGLKEDRVLFDLDIYRELTQNAIGLVPVPGTSGFDFGLANTASILNQGVELSMSSAYQLGPTQASVQLFASLNSNEVQSLENIDGIRAGMPFAGIDLWSLITPDYPVSNFYGQRKNENGMFSLGSAAPAVVAGLYHAWKFKALDVSVTLHGAFGQKMINANRMLLENPNGEYNGYSEFIRSGAAPLFEPGKPPVFTEEIVEDASYLRLQNITVGYNFSSTLLTGSGIKKLRIYGQTENLLTWSSYSGLDPDVSHFGSSPQNMGIDLGSYPKAKIFLVGLNMEF